MAKELQPIIIKRKKAGHGGAHGGAWKVAFADFMTAMMCFFLVMWLMGADEETKAAVSHYFNNPTSAWRRDLSDKVNIPLGEKTGAGENVVVGADGAVPDDLVERPQKPINTHDIQSSTAGEILAQFLSDESVMSLDMLKFSVNEDQIFEKDSTGEWTKGSKAFLKRLGELTKRYKGTMTIESKYLNKSDDPTLSYEFQTSRAVALSKYIVENKWLKEESVHTKVTELKRDPASHPNGQGHDGPFGTPGSRKIEFTLTRD